MHIRISFWLTLLGVTSQFAYGFSMKPSNNRLIQSIAVSRNNPKLTENNYASVSVRPQFNALVARGGSSKASTASGNADGGNETYRKIANSIASLWATSGVVMILGKSIKRILPIAMEPFNGVAAPLSTFQLR